MNDRPTPQRHSNASADSGDGRHVDGKSVQWYSSSAILAAGGVARPGDPTPYDVLRRKYLQELSAHTGRATIWYATAFLENKQVEAGSQNISLQDLQGFMEAISNVRAKRWPRFPLGRGLSCVPDLCRSFGWTILLEVV